MRVLSLCPLWYPISQDAPGGIETFLSRLFLEFKELGVETTFIAAGDSCAPGALRPVVDKHLYEQMQLQTAAEYIYYEQHQLWMALDRFSEFDIIHSHLGPGAYVLSALPQASRRVLHTHHTPVGRDLEWFVRQHSDMFFSTVSEFQARKIRNQGGINCHVIPNGIDVSSYPFSARGDGTLLFIGRMEWVKGPDLAVQIARSLGRELVMAGPIVEHEFFDRTVKPFLGDRVRYVGVVDHRRKSELFGQAACVLLPFRGEEPFGLVTVEAMACGVPVVALANGALPEIVENGLTGFITYDEHELTELVEQAVRLDRKTIREQVTKRFEISAIAMMYKNLYTDMLGASRP